MAAEAQITLSLIDRVTGPIRRIQARMSRLSAGLGLNRISAQLGNVGRSARGLANGFGAVARRAGLLAGALGLGTGGLAAVTVGLARRAAQLGSSLTDMSSRLGVSVEAIQELRYAAQMGGMGVQNFDVAFRRFIRRSAQAANGTGAAAKAFKEMGIQLRDGNGRLRAAEDVLGDVAEAMTKVPDQADRLRLAFAMFDTDGAAMVNVLQNGRDSLVEMRREARRTGNVMSAEAAALGGQYSANVDRLNARLDGLKTLIGVQLLPVIISAQERILEWVDANLLLIRSTIVGWVERLRDAIRSILDPASEFRIALGDLIDNVTGFLEAIRPVVDFLGGPMQASLIAVAAYIVGPMVTALAIFGGALIKLGLVILSTPIGWILAGIAAIAGAVYLVYTEWDAFVGYWEGVWQRISGVFDGTWSGFLSAFIEFSPVTHIVRGISAVIEYLTGVDLLDIGAGIIASLWDGITAKFVELDAWLAGVEAGISNFFRIDLSAIGRYVVDTFKSGLQSAWTGVVEWFKSAVAGLSGMVPEFVRSRLGWDVEKPRIPDVSTVGSVPVGGGTIETPSTDYASRAARPGIETPAANFAGSVPVGPTIEAPRNPSQLAAESVQAGRVEAGTLEVPEPLLVHKPQAIDASTHLGELHLHGVQMDNPGAIRSAVDEALRNQSRRASDAARSELAD